MCGCVIHIQCENFVRLQPEQFRELEQILGREDRLKESGPLWLTKFQQYLGLLCCELPLVFDSCVTPTFYRVLLPWKK